MCNECGKKISVLYSMSVQELLNYAKVNRSSPAAAHGRLDEGIAVLRKNGGCASCIRTLEDTRKSIF